MSSNSTPARTGAAPLEHWNSGTLGAPKGPIRASSGGRRRRRRLLEARWPLGCDRTGVALRGGARCAQVPGRRESLSSLLCSSRLPSPASGRLHPNLSEFRSTRSCSRLSPSTDSAPRLCPSLPVSALPCPALPAPLGLFSPPSLPCVVCLSPSTSYLSPSPSTSTTLPLFLLTLSTSPHRPSPPPLLDSTRLDSTIAVLVLVLVAALLSPPCSPGPWPFHDRSHPLAITEHRSAFEVSRTAGLLPTIHNSLSHLLPFDCASASLPPAPLSLIRTNAHTFLTASCSCLIYPDFRSSILYKKKCHLASNCQTHLLAIPSIPPFHLQRPATSKHHVRSRQSQQHPGDLQLLPSPSHPANRHRSEPCSARLCRHGRLLLLPACHSWHSPCLGSVFKPGAEWKPGGDVSRSWRVDR